MSQFVDDLRKLERSKNAQFTLEGVIAARTPEAGQKTHDAIQHICSVIIEAYRNANDSSKAVEDKQAAILKVVDLSSDLDWIVTFTQDEASNCRYPQHAEGMKKISELITSQVNTLKSDFAVLKSKLEVFNHIFDVMLAVLEQVTEFLKEGHGAEVVHVIEQGKNAYAEAKNLSNIEVPSLLVPQSKLVKDRAEDFLKKCQNLVTIQEGTNQSLKDRVSNVGLLMQSAIPNLIVKSKDHLLHMGQPDHQSFKDEQIDAYKNLLACLDEINRILERIRAKYTNSFDEDKLKANRNLDDLDKAANDLFSNLAKLKVPSKPEDEQANAAGVVAATKNALAAVQGHNGTPEQQKELVTIVKEARDGGIPEYFAAADKMDDLLTKVRDQPSFQIAIATPVAVADDGPRDMLEAAKAMCAALKGLNISLDQ